MLKVGNLLLTLTEFFSIIRGIIYSLAGTILLLLSSFQLQFNNPTILEQKIDINKVLTCGSVILCLGIMSIVNKYVTTIGIKEKTKYNYILCAIFSTLCLLPIGIIGAIINISYIPNKIESVTLNK